MTHQEVGWRQMGVKQERTKRLDDDLSGLWDHRLPAAANPWAVVREDGPHRGQRLPYPEPSLDGATGTIDEHQRGGALPRDDVLEGLTVDAGVLLRRKRLHGGRVVLSRLGGVQAQGAPASSSRQHRD